jgi:hypothetical protein
MARCLLRVSFLGFVLVAGAAPAAQGQVPLRLGCPSGGERVGLAGASFDEVVAAARRVLYREVTHYQGRRERRTAVNTPITAVVVELGSGRARLQGQGRLLGQASELCGRRVARSSSAVLFVDGLSIIASRPPITLFVVRTDRSVRVYPWPHH